MPLMKCLVSIYSLLLLLVLTVSSPVCQAQCPSDKGQLEIAGSHGFFTTSQLTDNTTANDNAAAGRGGKSQTYNSGTTFITIRYFLYNRLALGVSGGVAEERGQYTDKYTPSRVSSTYTESITTIAPEVYYIYFFRKYLEVYTLFGVGSGLYTTTTTAEATPYAAATTTTEKHNALRLHYTPVGIRVGGRIGGFVELGIGYKGIVNAGLAFKFGSPCWWR